MRIVVFGATGYVGSLLATEAVSRGIEVVGVARSFEERRAPVGVMERAGSIYDRNSLDELAEWADALVVALPGRPIDGRSLSDEVPALLAAAEKHGTRLGVVGGAGGLHTRPGGPRIVDSPDFPAAIKPESLGAADVYDALSASDTDADWFYVAPSRTFGAHAPGERTGRFRIGGDEVLLDENGESRISGPDFAIAFVDELERPQHHRRRFTVGY